MLFEENSSNISIDYDSFGERTLLEDAGTNTHDAMSPPVRVLLLIAAARMVKLFWCGNLAK
jgi:hypothetical protein